MGPKKHTGTPAARRKAHGAAAGLQISATGGTRRGGAQQGRQPPISGASGPFPARAGRPGEAETLQSSPDLDGAAVARKTAKRRGKDGGQETQLLRGGAGDYSRRRAAAGMEARGGDLDIIKESRRLEEGGGLRDRTGSSWSRPESAGPQGRPSEKSRGDAAEPSDESGDPSDMSGKTRDTAGRTSNTVGSSRDTAGRTSNTAGKSSDTFGDPTDDFGNPSNTSGKSRDTAGRSRNTTITAGEPSDTSGKSSDSSGKSSNTFADPGDELADPANTGERRQPAAAGRSTPAAAAARRLPPRRARQPPLIMHIPKLAPAARRAAPLFVEPALAPPTPGYSGHALETPPPLKLRRGRKPKAPAARGPRPAAPSDAQLQLREHAYARHLQTARLDSLTAASGVRSELAPPRKRGRPSLKDKRDREDREAAAAAPATPATPRAPAVKRIKIISPKRSNAVLGARAAAPPEPAPAPPAGDNDDFCAACGGTGVFICCDTCPRSFHLLCCDPPLRDVPEDSWHCRACRPPAAAAAAGMFGALVAAAGRRMPGQFRLPRRLRDATFIGVATGDDGAYSDTLAKREAPGRGGGGGGGAQIPGFNHTDALDVDALYAADGTPHLCHRCGLSGLRQRTLAFCDYCPLLWHLDCLPVPTCLAKTRGQKWRCPNHVEAAVPLFWAERRSFRDACVLDAAAHHNFLRFVRANDVLFRHAGQPPLDPAAPTLLADYREFQARSFLSPDTAAVDALRAAAGASPVPGDGPAGASAPAHDVVPEHLQNFAAAGRVVARSSGRPAKVLLMTSADDPRHHPFVYRVPEHQVVLDFVDKARRSRSAILQDIMDYDSRIAADKARDGDAVRALLAIHTRASLPARDRGLGGKDRKQNGCAPKTKSAIGADTAAGAATAAGADITAGPNITAGLGTAPNLGTAPKLEPAPADVRQLTDTLFGPSAGSMLDAAQLRLLRSLIQAKGRDALLRFLAS